MSMLRPGLPPGASSVARPLGGRPSDEPRGTQAGAHGDLPVGDILGGVSTASLAVKEGGVVDEGAVFAALFRLTRK